MEDDVKQLEKDREKLEEARAKLEEERARLEEERAQIHHEHKTEHREFFTEEQQRRIEDVQDKVERAMEGVQNKIENAIAGIDFDKLDRNINIEVKRSTKNLGILNLKDITAEELDRMDDIKNLGVIIAPEELMSKVSAKVTKNLGTIVPYKKGWRLYSGHTVIEKAMLEALDEPLEFIQTGHLEFTNDVTPELVKEKVKAFHNYGHVQATEATYGAVMAKCLENYGDISKNGKN